MKDGGDWDKLENSLLRTEKLIILYVTLLGPQSIRNLECHGMAGVSGADLTIGTVGFVASR